jgi:hypothetical protein
MSAPSKKRRGRPRKHKDSAARARAYRHRLRFRKLGTTRAKAVAAWNRLSPAQQSHVLECVTLTQQIQSARYSQDFERVEQLEEMLAYAEQMERQRIRDERAAASKTPDSLNRGLYLTDAPHGKGLLIFLIDPAADSDRKTANDDGTGGGRRVTPKGWGIHIEQQKRLESEYDDTFIQKVFKDGSRLRCYVKGCRRLPWGQRNDGKVHCELHAPLIS